MDGFIAACCYKVVGCDEKPCLREEKRKHEMICEYGPCKCPVPGCNFEGPMLFQHVNDEHIKADENNADGDAFCFTDTITVDLLRTCERKVLLDIGNRRVIVIRNSRYEEAGSSLRVLKAYCYGLPYNARPRFELSVPPAWRILPSNSRATTCSPGSLDS